MTPFRILHCLRAPVGGLFRHVRDLARAQAERGHLVGVLCDANASDPLTDDRLKALEPHLTLGLFRVPMAREVGLEDLSATRATQRHAVALDIDILHGHGAKGGAYARIAVSGIKTAGGRIAGLYTPHGGSLHYDPRSLKGRIYMGMERLLAARGDGIIFESAYSAAAYAEKVGTAPCATRVIHNGILAEELDPAIAADDAADFLFIGELRKLKGVDLLIEATRRLAADGPCRTVIVGAGPDEAEFRATVEAHGLKGLVTFAGAMPARRAFPLGRVLVMPSRAESFPYVALEAAGAAIPLIASRVGGLPEIVAGTDTALVAPDDASALAAAMRDARDQPAAARARAVRLRTEIGRRFTVSAMTDGVLDFYATALAARSATSAAAATVNVA